MQLGRKEKGRTGSTPSSKKGTRYKKKKEALLILRGGRQDGRPRKAPPSARSQEKGENTP